MGVIRNTYPDRESWLSARKEYIGASEISSVVGVGFQSPMSLWMEKRGMKEHADFSDNERVSFGNRAEDPLRDMFRLMHPEYELSFTPYLIVRQEDAEYGFLSDTPDGELVEIETGRRGLYESKTATCLKKTDWDQWKEKIPTKYYCQICQGMFCGDYEYAVVWALLLNADGDGELRAYHFEKEDCLEDIEALKEAGKRFHENIVNGTLPSVPLTIFE